MAIVILPWLHNSRNYQPLCRALEVWYTACRISTRL